MPLQKNVKVRVFGLIKTQNTYSRTMIYDYHYSASNAGTNVPAVG